MQIGSGEGSGLEKICYAPLTSQFTGPLVIEQCVLQSVWGYFQGSEENFDHTETDAEGFVVNYLDHIVMCTQ
jgi:Niemann-Pick C1 protein